MSTTTTTPYCFESGVQWTPIDMRGTYGVKEVDEFACQKKCMETQGCSHFSFWKLGRLCHLQDRYAQRREYREGFISGPFQCWSYLVPGEYTKLDTNHTYVPTQFRCMQIGVTWAPDLTSTHMPDVGHDELVFKCQQKCQDTEGCRHFTAMFPGLCRLAGEFAVPVPAEQAISGPPSNECDEPASDADFGHTLMRKFESGPWVSTPSFLSRPAAVGPVALLSAVAAALVWQRRTRTSAAFVRPMLVDLEESIEGAAQE